MSKKYFLFSGLTLMLLEGLYDIVSIIYSVSISSSSSTYVLDFTTVLIFCLINLFLSIPSLVLTILAFKNKKDSLAASVLLIAASIIYFGYRIFSLTKMMQIIMYPDQDIKMMMYWLIYALAQVIFGLLPVALAILSLFNFRKNEQDYVVSSKLNNVFYYIVMTIAFQAFILYFTAGIRISLIMNGFSDIYTALQAIVFDVSSLVIIGAMVPSFIFSFFNNKQKISRRLALLAAITVLGVHIFSTIITFVQATQYDTSVTSSLVFLEVLGTMFECVVLAASMVLMLIKFKSKQSAQIKTELE
ncbi:MAG: hypothetical protein J6N95_06280 [Bacilli bacterium]|nr:hypothetical protein [Bacilli bacterium]